MSAKKETLGKTLGVVIAVCLVCSIIVSGAAVGLRDLQQINAAKDKQTNILEAAGIAVTADCDVICTFDKYVDERHINIATGEYVEVEDGFDMYKAANDPKYTVKVENSNVGFQRRSSVASVYIVKTENGAVDRIVLPVHGSGLWDLMYGFLAVDSDGNTIRELVYYQQKETPGLGGEVLNPGWKSKWDGKKLYKNGEVAIDVQKNANPNNEYAVDALSGATLTSNGVENTLVYWAGENGYGPYLKNQNWKS
ncbi:Na(+)-translocating NADH-quinone reductase subunit C [Aliiglaciecola sp. LCG003]|uniref:Na(+)-translocating NADH-quinone reductase subunit C n=1 Tax=Aliiglaciecola sp. LCG003 TaxID=3053655 RepID=UPI0025728705|nr:Na(+)-translocating NADH-quinone reductase subunit C [Aliiglaciecola sp. LCG003]WJG08996.1 Na(+)-translocating NADH-quinone reductase subunit C [Aliiglaciecola sp. LCG003]